MKLIIEKIHIHHFLSIEDVEIKLKDRGYCLVSGTNKNPKDAAKSNGSGKSSIWNALCFALTGETISGLKTNLANIAFNDGCYVALDFTVDNKTYKIIRSKDDAKYGTNLKIYIDNEDKSGKGIRESQALFDEYLPDLTKELIASVVILGQGLPDKFTGNTPSGRKEILEHLSKSDFMIQDLKDRIEERSTKLNSKKRELEDAKLSKASKVDILNTTITKKEEELQNYQDSTKLDDVIKHFTSEVKRLDTVIDCLKSRYDFIMSNMDQYNADYLDVFNKKRAALDNVGSQHKEVTDEFTKRKIELNTSISNLRSTIKQLESITDVCPTCGQKIPGAVKPDTSKQKKELEASLESLSKLEQEIKEDETSYNDILNEINKKYDEDLNNKKKILDEALRESKEVSDLKDNRDRNERQPLIEKLNKATAEKASFDNTKANLERDIKEMKDSVISLDDEISSLSLSITDLDKHLDVISKMNTAVKRDFRGILLSHIIDYINNKAREYCSKIFNNNEINFELNGNNIDITYCKKDYDNLSGGEKQRIDIITQFAIRDMMSEYLDFSSNILVLDEITDNLDSVSCERVINFITQELKDVDSVFIISHHGDLEIPYDSQIIVEKDTNGISNIVERM